MMKQLANATRWASALITVLGFLIGIPILLLAAPSPLDSERGVSSLVRAIVDDTQIFDEALISALVAVAWVLWAYLTLAAIAEAGAMVRGGVVSLRGLRLGQTLARPVIGALMWSSTATGLAASTIGAGTVALIAEPAAAQAEPLRTDSVTSGETGREFGLAIGADEIVQIDDDTLMVRGELVHSHLVEADDTMWDLAERHLNDPFRWREIANLNPDIDDPDLIHPGQLLYMPNDATGLNQPQPEPAESDTRVSPAEADDPSTLAEAIAATGDIYAADLPIADETPPPIAAAGDDLADATTVAPGDTLWDLAEERLTSTTSHEPSPAEIAAAVEAVDPDLLRSGNPDLIYPEEVVVWRPNAPGAAPTAEPAEDAPAASADPEPAEATPAAAADPAAAEPRAEQSSPSLPAELTQPPAGQFFGQLPTNGELPVPPAGADITTEAFPTAPATGSGLEIDGERAAGWDPANATATATADDVGGLDDVDLGPPAVPEVPVPVGAPVQPETNSTVNADDLAERDAPRTITSVNWTVVLGALPLLAAGIWAALRRRRKLRTARRPSRYLPEESDAIEDELTEAVAGSDVLARAGAVRALSGQLGRWVPFDAPLLLAVTVDDTDTAVLWDSDTAPEPIGESTLITVEGASWRIPTAALAATDVSSDTLHGLPALVQLGRLDSGRDLLVNLEDLARVELAGDPAQVEQFCARLAIELALNPLFELATLVLVGFGEQLAALDTVDYYTTSQAAATAITGRVETINSHLSTSSALQRRATGRVDCDISPIVVLDLTGETPAELGDLATDAAGGLCLLQLGDGADCRWPLTIDGDTAHLGGPIDATTTTLEPTEEAIAAIAELVAAGIDYQPGDTIEGTISDTIVGDPILVDLDSVGPNEHDAELRAFEQLIDTADQVDDLDQHEPPWRPSDGPAEDDLVVWTPDVDDDDDVWRSDLRDEPPAAAPSVTDGVEPVVLSLPDPLPSSTGVRVRILGRVTAEGVDLTARRTELVALMLANGGKVTVDEISTHMYGGDRDSTPAILQLLTRVRKDLGETPEGEPRLSYETPTSQYELTDVSSDLQQLLETCDRIKTNPSLSTAEACELMDAAAQLIEGPPYAGSGERYDWAFTAGGAVRAQIAADAMCRELGEVYLALGEYPRARWSVRQGLKACPACDELYEALVRVIGCDGTRQELDGLWKEILAAYQGEHLEVPQSLATAVGDATAAMRSTRPTDEAAESDYAQSPLRAV